MIFLGTGAAEMMPNVFCDCEVCTKLRVSGEKPRRRSSFMLNEHCLIDLGPDVLAAAQELNVSFANLKDLFVTHTHRDHFNLDNIDVLTMTSTWVDKTLNIWLSRQGYEWVQRRLDADDLLYPPVCGPRMLEQQGKIAFKVMPSYQEVEISGMKVFAVESNHRGYGVNEPALNYLITTDKHKLFYVADSGLYSEENLEALRNARADILIMEGTCGNLPLPREANHLNAQHFIENVCQMEKYGVINKNTAIYVTHINQRNTMNHAEYQQYMDSNCPLKVTVGQDGLRIFEE